MNSADEIKALRSALAQIANSSGDGGAALRARARAALALPTVDPSARLLTDAEIRTFSVLCDALFEASGRKSPAAAKVAQALGIKLKGWPPIPAPAPIDIEVGHPIPIRIRDTIYRALVVQLNVEHRYDQSTFYDGTDRYARSPGVRFQLELIAEQRDVAPTPPRLASLAAGLRSAGLHLPAELAPPPGMPIHPSHRFPPDSAGGFLAGCAWCTAGGSKLAEPCPTGGICSCGPAGSGHAADCPRRIAIENAAGFSGTTTIEELER